MVNKSCNQIFSYVIFYLLIIILVLITGSRDWDIGTDTKRYLEIYTLIYDKLTMVDAVEPGFEVLLLVSAYFGFPPLLFLILISALNFALFILLGHRLANTLDLTDGEVGKFVIIFLMLLLVSPWFMSGQINGIRQGFSSVLIVLAALSFIEKRYVYYALWSALAISFHFSAAMFSILIWMLLLKFRDLILISFTLLVMYISGFSRELVEYISLLFDIPLFNFIKSYGTHTVYKSGVRLDFVLFSVLAPLMVFVYMILFRLTSPIIMEKIKLTISIYLILLVPFWLFGWGNFSNRYVWTAWLMIPMIWAFPFFISWGKKLSVGVLISLVILSSFIYLWYLNYNIAM